MVITFTSSCWSLALQKQAHWTESPFFVVLLIPQNWAYRAITDRITSFYIWYWRIANGALSLFEHSSGVAAIWNVNKTLNHIAWQSRNMSLDLIITRESVVDSPRELSRFLVRVWSILRSVIEVTRRLRNTAVRKTCRKLGMRGWEFISQFVHSEVVDF